MLSKNRPLSSYISPEVLHRIRVILHRTGVRESNLVEVLDQIREAMDKSKGLVKTLSEPDDGRSVIIWSIRGSLFNNVIEALLGHVLQVRGVPVQVIVCDGVLPACEGRSLNGYPRNKVSLKVSRNLCKSCRFLSHEIFGGFGLPIVTLEQYITEDTVKSAQKMVCDLTNEKILSLTYMRIALGDIIRSSVVRFFLRLDFEKNRQADQLVRDFAASAIILTEVSNRLFEKFQPRSLLTSHGIYVTWGVAVEVAKQRKIPITVYGKGYRRSTLLMAHGGSYWETLSKEPSDSWEFLELTDYRRQRLQRYLDQRWKPGSEDSMVIYDGAAKMLSNFHSLGLDPNKPTLGLFPNVPWDADAFFRSMTFRNIVETAVRTVEFFKEHPEWQLVIREHPLAKWFPANLRSTASDVVTQQLTPLPKNVRLISPEDPVSSYDIAKHLSAVVVHASQIGLELACRGMPVIVTGNTAYRGKGFTYDPASEDEYFKLLARFPDLPALSSDLRNRAQRYAYHYYFRRLMPFPYFENSGLNSIGKLNLTSLTDLIPEKDPALNTIVAGILKGTPFIFDG